MSAARSTYSLLALASALLLLSTPAAWAVNLTNLNTATAKYVGGATATPQTLTLDNFAGGISSSAWTFNVTFTPAANDLSGVHLIAEIGGTTNGTGLYLANGVPVLALKTGSATAAASSSTSSDLDFNDGAAVVFSSFGPVTAGRSLSVAATWADDTNNFSLAVQDNTALAAKLDNVVVARTAITNYNWNGDRTFSVQNLPGSGNRGGLADNAASFWHRDNASPLLGTVAAGDAIFWNTSATLAVSYGPPVNPSLTINRDNGNITFANPTGLPVTLIGYSLTTASGAFNTDPATWNEINGRSGAGSWTRLTPAGNTNGDLSEATLGAGYTVPGLTGTVDFGNVWRRSPFEDIVAEFRDASGNIVPLNVQYSGNGGNPFLLGDFDFQNGVDAGDWAILRSRLISDVADDFSSYALGDINVDGMIDVADFDAFKVAYNAANGAGSFAAMLSGVPEPSSVMLVALGLASVGLVRGRRRLAVALATILIAAASPALAVNLYTDTFDRPDSTNIDASLAGTSGTAVGTADNFLIENGDPLVLPTVALPDPQTLTNIENNQLHLADGPNATTYYINHNFVDAAIVNDGVLSISMQIISNDGPDTTNNNFIGFGLGSTLAQHQGQTQLDNGATATEPAIRGTADAVADGFADLWVGWSPTGTGQIQLFKNGVLARTWDDLVDNYIPPVGQPNEGVRQPGTLANNGVATLELRLGVENFEQGTVVSNTIYFNGVAIGGDAFRWDATDANYIGVNARQGGAGFTADNFAITTSTDPLSIQSLHLEVHTDTGEVFLVGGASVSFVIDRYTVSSIAPNAGLIAANFNGIGGDDGLPDGTGAGDGWELGGVQTDNLINEFYLGTDGQGSSNLPTTFRASLGLIYDTVADTRDLMLTYRRTDGTITNAGAIYMLAPPPAGLAGDFNGDGTVDAADYTVYRDNDGGAETAFATGTGSGNGTIGSEDYDLWRANFGATSPPGSLLGGNGAVPEPSSLVAVLTLIAISGGLSARRWGR